MNLDPRTVVILTVLSTLLMSISLFAVARGYLAEMRGVTRWASGTLLQSTGWILLALIGILPAYIAELGSPFIMLGLALYYHALVAFKQAASRVSWVYIVVALNLLAIFYFLLVVPDMSARIVVASATGAVLMFASARLLFSERISRLPVSHGITGSLFAVCSAVLTVRAVYYLVWNTAPDQSAFEHNLVQDVAFLTFFLAGVVSSFTFILMCNDRYNAKALVRTQELASKNVELEEASRIKGQFLATMSHELRTPLNGVIGFLGQLGKTRLDEKQQDYLHTVDLSARMLLGLINDILDFSKIEAGKLEMEAVEIDLRPFLDELITMFSVSAEAKGIELVYIIDQDVPARLIGDPLRLTQVLSNLLSNAIKFTEQGEVLLEVHARAQTDSEVSLEICVSDTGIGISEESLSRLFQPFVQADASTTRKHGGTGLGLIIAKRLIEMMGGSIEVHSRLCHGTRFSIHLSLPRLASAVEETLLAESFPHLQVLIVSSNANVIRSISENISVLGMTSTGVSSGLAALGLVKDASHKGRAFDAVIFDDAVSDIVAVNFAGKIRADAHLHGVQLLLLANVCAGQTTGESQQGGYSCVIGKPARFSELYQGMGKLFASATAARVCGISGPENTREESLIRPLAGKAVLIVDDNNINRKLMQLLVHELGAEFDLAENGSQAVAACSAKCYDLVLMDVNMPVMDGLEATKRIRALESGSPAVSIIALTANALPGEKERFIACGMDDYLSKPVNEKSLLAILCRLFPQELVPLPGSETTTLPDKAAGHNTPALDPRLGVQLSFGDPDTWHLVLGLLLDDLADYTNKLVEFSADVDQLSYIAHKLAGSSCYCGTPALHQAAKQVEVLCAGGDIQSIQAALSALQQEIERLLALDAAGRLRGSEVVVY